MTRSIKLIAEWMGAVAILSFSPMAGAQALYSAVQIGGGGTAGNGVNDRGQVVGQNSAGQAFVTGANGLGVTILAPTAGQSNQAIGINNRGQVLVTPYAKAESATSGYITGPNAIGKYLLSPLPGGNFLDPRGLNSIGQVVGASGYESVSASDKTPTFQSAFITGPNGTGTTSIANLPGSEYPGATGINDHGEVSGFYTSQADSAALPFITGPNGVGIRELNSTVFNGLGGLLSGEGINARGQVLVSWFSGSFNAQEGFLTGPNGNGGVNLGYVPDCNCVTVPLALNDWGQVVGQAEPVAVGSNVAFVYSQGEMKDLNSMIDPEHPLPSGTILSGANAISNTGKIVATGLNGTTLNGTTSSTWLLTPCEKSNACGGNIFWRNSDGEVVVWFVSGGTVVSTANLGNPGTQWSIGGSGDFTGTGDADIVWTDTSGDVMVWYVSEGALQSSVNFGKVATSWSVAGVGDFNGDGMSDILWRNTNGDIEVWFMNGKTHSSSASLGSLPAIWTCQGIGDVNGDGTADIVWRDTQGEVVIWLMSGGALSSMAHTGVMSEAWTIGGVADFDGDGQADILWHNASNGQSLIWFLSGGTLASSQGARTLPTSWSIAATGDFNGNGKHDILWRDTSGDTVVWDMSGITITSSSNLNNMPAALWNVVR